MQGLLKHGNLELYFLIITPEFKIIPMFVCYILEYIDWVCLKENLKLQLRSWFHSPPVAEKTWYSNCYLK